MKCDYYEQQKCFSCPWMGKPYRLQLNEKQALVQKLLSPFSPNTLFPVMASQQVHFRNKAKMAVLGTVENPILGIVTQGQHIDLCDCPLYPDEMRLILSKLKGFLKKLQLVPYNINKKKGEIKFIILTQIATQGQNEFMLRLVLRSDKDLNKIKTAIGDIQQVLPQLSVISVNIQPVHAAVLEGDVEHVLTEKQHLLAYLNNIPLFIRPKSFFQTNTEVAANLYATAREWLAPLAINKIWDLFCGVGGFGLHCITPQRELVGIEINPEAIECATKSAKLMAYDKLIFKSLDATQFALQQAHDGIPDAVLVNPPRRGIGEQLTQYLQHISPNYILYSSCNIHSLITDLSQLTHYQVMNVQLFDMFPHTEHMEILVLLKNVVK